MTLPLITMDFETYSEAGYYKTPAGKWAPIRKNKSGIEIVGTYNYTAHPSTRVLCLHYDIGTWVPMLPQPQDLFDHIRAGGLIEAHYSLFEYFTWLNVCHKRMGWPELPLGQVRCSKAKIQAFGGPGKLEKAAEFLDSEILKDPAGKRLIKRLSIPHNGKPVTYEERDGMIQYCITDVKAEKSISLKSPDLSTQEMPVFMADQRINTRGVRIDIGGVEDCISVFEQAERKYNDRLYEITGYIDSASKVQELVAWLNVNGVRVKDLDKESVETLRKNADKYSDIINEVIDIRYFLALSSVKKLYALKYQTGEDERVRCLFAIYGAERTGRWAGVGPQPQNMPSGGPSVRKCTACNRYCGAHNVMCPRCWSRLSEKEDWGFLPADDALVDMTFRDLDYIEGIWGHALKLISGCIRGLFIAAEGKELICSDFSSIEAMVLAFISGEEWRMNVFRTHGKIYEACMSSITGIPFEDILEYKRIHGVHHPDRKKYGKIPELASGYQGWIGAWKRFGADKFMTDDEIKDAILKWRANSPMIAGVKQYGKIVQHGIWSGLEWAAKSAVSNPGSWFTYRYLSYGCFNDILHCKLPSGRFLYYHKPHLNQVTGALSFLGYNNTTKKIERIETYGGKMTENDDQGVSRDIMAEAIVRIDPIAPVVLHVHDEPVSEVPKGSMDIRTYESMMMIRPQWAQDWPIKAGGGWVGQRYRKD